MNTKPRPLRVISNLPREEQWEIYLLLKHRTYKQVAALILERHGQVVSENTLTRHYRRCCEHEAMEQLPEIRQNAAAWINFRETGDPVRFDHAALEVLKMRAFQLSETLKDRQEFTQLKGVFSILLAARSAHCRERNTAVNERLATVREVEALARLQKTEAQLALLKIKNPSLQNTARLDSPVARALLHCGGLPELLTRFQPGERLNNVIIRLNEEFTACAPGQSSETGNAPSLRVLSSAA